MLIDEIGLIRAIKSAYKNGGYTVNNMGDTMAIYTENWIVKCHHALLPRKVMATMVEHMGMIPEKNAPVSICKDGEPQQIMNAVAAADVARWCTGEQGDDTTITPVTMQGYQIFQIEGGGACWGVPFTLMGMIKRDVAEHTMATVVDGDRLVWKCEGEAVAISAVRKDTSSWAKKRERAVWDALESVDLHKEEV